MTNTRRRNPADATIRNVRAARGREARILERVKLLELAVRALARDVLTLKRAR